MASNMECPIGQGNGMEDDPMYYCIRYLLTNDISYVKYFTLQELARGFHICGDDIDWQYIETNHHSGPSVYIKFADATLYSFALIRIIRLDHLYYFAKIGLDQYKIKDMEASLPL